jgi:hypothetical protein
MHKACRCEWHTSIHVCSADGPPCTHAIVRGCCVLTVHLIAVCHFGSTWCHLHLHAVDHIRLTASQLSIMCIPGHWDSKQRLVAATPPRVLSSPDLRLVLPWQNQFRVCALKLLAHAYWCAAYVSAATRAMCTCHCWQSCV